MQFGFILCELLWVWSEVAEVPALATAPEEVKLSARETDFLRPQLLVWLRMLHIVLKDRESIYIGLGRSVGGVALVRAGGLFPMYIHSCPQVTCNSCFFKCIQHLCVVLVSAKYLQRFLATSDRMCCVVLDSVFFCPAIISRICDPDSLPGFHSFRAWFELTEHLWLCRLSGSIRWK